MKALPLFILIFVIQVVILCFIDPLGHPDTIRYLNLADFLQHPGVAHYGDLAYDKGLLYTPLFLPFFLALLKKIAHFPYLLSGAVLQIISFQSVVWLSYAIAARLDCNRTAKLAAALLLTNPVFWVNSVFILTEYPFMAVLLFTVYYIMINDIIHLKHTVIISILFGLLVSIRVQGFLFMAAIISFLLYSRKTRSGYVPILCSVPVLYILFYISFYVFLDRRFPSTITMNEVFSINFFFLGNNPDGYSFSVHGLEAVVLRKASSYAAFFDPKTYAGFIYAQCSSFVHLLKPLRLNCDLFFAGLTCLAFVFSRIRWKKFLVFLIIFNLLVIAALPVSYESLLRYQTVLFPLAIILIASFFSHCHEGEYRKSNFRKFVLFISVLLYGFYFVMRQCDFVQSFGPGEYTRRTVLKEEAAASARLISDGIGSGRNAIGSYPIYYNAIYRSGNIPAYFFEGWERPAIIDYIKARSLRYIVCQHNVVSGLKSKGIDVKIMNALLKDFGAADQLFLCELSIT